MLDSVILKTTGEKRSKRRKCWDHNRSTYLRPDTTHTIKFKILKKNPTKENPKFSINQFKYNKNRRKKNNTGTMETVHPCIVLCNMRYKQIKNGEEKMNRSPNKTNTIKKIHTEDEPNNAKIKESGMVMVM